MLRELLPAARINTGWIVRTSPNASLRAEASELGLPRLLVLLLGVHASYYGLWVLSWWLLGSMVFQGRLAAGWLLPWCLVLVSLIPFRILVTSVGGKLVVRGSALLKRRLLFNSLQLDPDQIRRFGSGQLLGRVLEAETLDQMALGGGVLSITALVELIFAGLVLSQGVAGIAHVMLLFAILIMTALIVAAHYRRRERWTDQRATLTDDLVERMAGHRTRLAQQPPDEWNEEEDWILAQYFESSVGLDRTSQWLNVLVPRGWFLFAIGALAPAVIYGQPTAIGLGISIGGILMGYGAFRDLAEGSERLAAAALDCGGLSMNCLEARRKME